MQQERYGKDDGRTVDDDSEDDCDYNYLADSSGLVEGEEEWVEGPQAEIPLEEVKDLVCESAVGTRSTRHGQLRSTGRPSEQQAAGGTDEPPASTLSPSPPPGLSGPSHGARPAASRPRAPPSPSLLGRRPTTSFHIWQELSRAVNGSKTLASLRASSQRRTCGCFRSRCICTCRCSSR